ncbi:MAG TPA: GNAT family N-acetyltransferase [Candidatus Limnocylindrales bacterium]|nr:GNAT family N-acetyltransferase [Candidatus Limnocylindrales bacterium]
MTTFVRVATIGDATVIGEVAAAAWRDTYTGLLRPATIEQFIAAAYSVETIVRRIERDTFIVADVDDSVRAFADAVEREGHVALAAIYAEPSWRGHGLGLALLDELRRRFPGQAIAADVLVGNRLGEAFYERRGFVARETLEADLFGEPVRERRWWLGEPSPTRAPSV